MKKFILGFIFGLGAASISLPAAFAEHKATWGAMLAEQELMQKLQDETDSINKRFQTACYEARVYRNLPSDLRLNYDFRSKSWYDVNDDKPVPSVPAAVASATAAVSSK